MTAPLLEVEKLVRDYVLPRRGLLGPRPRHRALHGVSFTVPAGRSFGVVGESGCGKSTLARLVLALEKPSAGHVRLHGRDLFALGARELRGMRRHMQIVFQDPHGSLDPRQRTARILAEPLRSLEPGTGRTEREERIVEALAAVGLAADTARHYPHEFSGGQRQRIALARALITRPDLIVADEPVSALDVSIQAQVLNLMTDLKEQYRLSYLFISHDLSVVRLVTDEVAVMLLGRIVEQGPTAAVLAAPRHPYSRALMDAIPRPGSGRRRGTGMRTAEPPAHKASEGCAYAPRCPLAEARCWRETPELRSLDAARKAACHLA